MSKKYILIIGLILSLFLISIFIVYVNTRGQEEINNTSDIQIDREGLYFNYYNEPYEVPSQDDE